MYFFVDPSQLPTQTSAQAYGPVSADTFRVTSQLTSSKACAAFACQAGQVLVVASATDNTLVNLILKPTEGLTVGLAPVRYYVYRGV